MTEIDEEFSHEPIENVDDQDHEIDHTPSDDTLSSVYESETFVIVRTGYEVSIYDAGGVLQRFAKDFLGQSN